MAVSCPFAHHELVGNLTVGQSPRDEGSDLTLSRRKDLYPGWQRQRTDVDVYPGEALEAGDDAAGVAQRMGSRQLRRCWL